MFTETQKKILLIVLIVSIVSALIGVFFSFQIGSFGTLLKILTMTMPQRQFVSNTNVLIAGIDSDAENTHRADSIMLVNINPYTKYIGLLSIPRDTRIAIRGHGQDKINHAFAFGGAKLLKESVANYLQIPIPYYVQLDMQGVGEIVDQIGGVPINVEKRMYYVDHSGDLYIDLYPGQQILDGKHALQYIRFRKDNQADLGRIERQQNFLRAFANKALSIGVIFKAPTILFKFSKYVKTDIPTSLLVDFSIKLKEAYQMGHLEIATIPSEPVIIDGINYQQADWSATQALVTRIIKGYEMYAGALPDFKKPPELKVQVLNGNGLAKMNKNACRKLALLGYDIADLRDAGRFDYKESLLVNWHGTETEDEAFSLARKLYIKPTNIIEYNYPQKPINFSIVLGKDWPLER